VYLRNALILAGIAAALILVVALLEGIPGTRQAGVLVARAFPELDGRTGRADAIEIIRYDAKIVLVKDVAKSGLARWRVSQPLKSRADLAAVLTFLAVFETAEKLQVDEKGGRDIPLRPGQDLAQYGLDQDSLTQVRISAGDETLLDAIVGGKAGETDTAYAARSAREALYIVDSKVRDEANRRVDEFRDKLLVDLSGSVVTRIGVLKDEKLATELTRSAGGPWRLTAPVADRANPAEASALADRVGKLHAEAFREDIEPGDPETGKKLAEHGLSPPRWRLEIAAEAGGTVQQHEVLFGEKVKKIVGGRASWSVTAMVSGTGTVVYVPFTVVEAFDVAADDLRDPAIVRFEIPLVETVELARPSGALRLERKDDAWTVASPDLSAPQARQADAGRVRALLAGLSDLQVEKFLPRGAVTADAATVTVTLRSSAQPETVSARFQFAGTGASSVGTDDRDASVEVPEALRRQLAAPPFYYWDRRVLSFAVRDMRKLSVTVDGRTDSARYDGDMGEWTAEGGWEIDYRAAAETVMALSSLAAEEYVGRADSAGPAGYGLDRPACRIEVVVRPRARGAADSTSVVLVGAPENGAASGEAQPRRYAMIEGRDEVFLLAGETASRLLGGLRKRPADAGAAPPPASSAAEPAGDR